MNDAVLTVLIAMLGGAIRVSTPFMFVALGECLTEKSGRVNLGLEGTLVLGAMVAYAVSYHTGSPWVGVLAAGVAGSCLGAMHGSICGLPRGQRRRGRHRDDAVRRRRRLLLRQALHPAGRRRGSPRSRSASGATSAEPEERAAGQSAVLRRHRHRASCSPGRSATPAGASSCAPSATAPPRRARWASRSIWVRFLTTTVGGFLAGVGGAFLSLSYPGSWNQGLSSGQGLMAVALVIFARWSPLRCVAGRASLRRRGRDRPVAAVGRRHAGLLLLQRRALHPDPRHHDRDLERQAFGARHAGRIVDGQIGSARMPTFAADPYPWPWNGDWRPDNTAVIVIDMQTDFCGKGGYVDAMGYDLSLTRAPIEPIRRAARRGARQGLSRHPHPRGPPARSRRPAGQQALALAAHRRRHRRRGPVRQDPGARRAGLGNHRGARAAAGRAGHRQARQGLVLRHRPRTHPAHPRHRQSRPHRHHHRRLRPHDDARGQRPRLRMPAAGRLLRRDRPRQSSRRDQDGDDAGRRVRRRRLLEAFHRGACHEEPPARRRSRPSA